MLPERPRIPCTCQIYPDKCGCRGASGFRSEAKRESGAAPTGAQCRSCPRNCKRPVAVQLTVTEASSLGKTGQQRRPVSQETCLDGETSSGGVSRSSLAVGRPSADPRPAQASAVPRPQPSRGYRCSSARNTRPRSAPAAPNAAHADDLACCHAQAAAAPDEAPPLRIVWIDATGIAAVHLLALLAFVPWLFSWTAVIVAFARPVRVRHAGDQPLLSSPADASRLCLSEVVRAYARRSRPLLDAGHPARWVAIHRHHHAHSDEQPTLIARWSTSYGPTSDGWCCEIARPRACASTAIRQGSPARPVLRMAGAQVSTGPGSMLASWAIFFSGGLCRPS